MAIRLINQARVAELVQSLPKALKKLFPDLTYEIERDKTPSEFYFGVPPVSIPPTPTAVASQQVVVSVTQSVSTTQIVQVGPQTSSVFSALADWAIQRDEQARQKEADFDAAKVNASSRQLLIEANPLMFQYLATVGKDSNEQFPVTAQAINNARDVAYKELTNPVQRAKFVQITNGYMRTFEKQMADHAKEQSSSYQESSKEEATSVLHQALDSWYANGKDCDLPPFAQPFITGVSLG